MSTESSRENPIAADEIKRTRMKDYLATLQDREPVTVGSTVTVIEGPHALKALKVLEVGSNGLAKLQASPDEKDIVEYPVSELYDSADVMEAYQHASE